MGALKQFFFSFKMKIKEKQVTERRLASSMKEKCDCAVDVKRFIGEKTKISFELAVLKQINCIYRAKMRQYKLWIGRF